MVSDRGSSPADGVATNVTYLPTGGIQYGGEGACVTLPGWEGVSSTFTVVMSFVAPINPPEVYTLWESGSEPNIARLYVSQGTVTLTYGSVVATGGYAVHGGASVRVAAACVGATCTIYM